MSRVVGILVPLRLQVDTNRILLVFDMRCARRRMVCFGDWRLKQGQKMNIEPLTPGFGAEISGVDVSALSDADFEGLLNAFTDYGVVFLRDQPALDGDSHSALARRFGEIHVHPAARGRAAEHPGRLDMLVKEDTRVAAGNRWHSDASTFCASAASS